MHHQFGFSVIFILLLTYLMSCINGIELLNLRDSGYESCLFHLFDYSRGTVKSNRLIEQVLVSSQGYQTWTVTDLRFSDMNSEVKLGTPYNFNEFCSVNLVIVTRNCYDLRPMRVFGSRLYDPSNTLFIIFDHHYTCDKLDATSWLDKTLVADVFLIYLHQSSLEVKLGLIFCSSCPWTLAYKSLELPLPELRLIKKFSAGIKAKAYDPIVAVLGERSNAQYGTPSVVRCSYLYEIRESTNTQAIGCDVGSIFVENAAARLNFSVKYYATQYSDSMGHFIHSAPKYFSAVAILGMGWNPWTPTISPVKIFHQFLVSIRQSKFIYCVKSEERETFSFWFWTIPFDIWSWIFIALIAFMLTCILKGQWFEVGSNRYTYATVLQYLEC